ncbi:hypothetical protein [Actinokineospora globicatena]|uniref:hypothetical protein n=1 Tax=Actinokineospora globicatena TaxID=103729 RepID=UPI0020A52836|nr:hypothetical protein [Actinokineospora globicatena]MCP2304078.1 hypothetical protein [Actinokineospora globicatena]GLW78572.1 hypothetical protein Aglo01_30540 [Actinokineospora globicatena]GLW84761.1 hypothetical protein Aglo02_24010 [Actinokineospora globicatena]
MTSRHSIPRPGFEPVSNALDAARSAFEWLVTGPHPVSIDGRLFPGFPARRVPLDEVCDRLLRRRCPQTVRDAVWAHLVLLSRTEGGTWTVGAVGVAMPTLTASCARLTARFAGDPSDICAAVLAGFVAELATVDLRRPRILNRLRWVAYRAGYACVRDALDAPLPSGHGYASTAPTPPSGHPDFVLADAVAAGVITVAEAELIGSTRFEDVSLADAAAVRDVSRQAVKKARRRAEFRLADYLLADIRDTPTTPDTRREPTPPNTDTASRPHAAGHRRGTGAPSRTATISGEQRAKKVQDRVSPRGQFSGVERRGRTHTPANPPPQPQSLSGTTPGASRCA